MEKEQKIINKNDIYRHYKGGEYKILDFGFSTENEVPVVIYQSLKDQKIWVRSQAEFIGEVEVKGKIKPRFEFIKNDEGEDFSARYYRALADYQNLQRQAQKDKEEFFSYAVANFVQEILPIYDNLKMSINGLSEEVSQNPWVEGIKYVIKQFKDFLESKGITEIKTIGEKFDHNTMDALEGTGENVVKEIKAGYKLNGKVLIPAKVIVE